MRIGSGPTILYLHIDLDLDLYLYSANAVHNVYNIRDMPIYTDDVLITIVQQIWRNVRLVKCSHNTAI